VGPLVVVEVDVLSQAVPGFLGTAILVQVDLWAKGRAPRSIAASGFTALAPEPDLLISEYLGSPVLHSLAGRLLTFTRR